MQLNFVDRVVAYLAPRRAAARVNARAHMARALRVQALYEGAGIGRRTAGWRAVGTDANAETRMALGRLREVSRDMVRNNPLASRAKATITHNVVGSGILPSIKAGSEKRANEIKALFARHLETTAIDADGRLNLYGLQALAMSTIVESGEVLIRMRPRNSRDDLALPFQLQILEPAACFAAFITSETPEDTANLAEPAETSPDGYPIEAFEPGMIERLKVGESVSFATPPSTSDFDGYSKVTHREIAAGLNVPYEALTGDLSGVNFSSGRMGWLEYQRSIDAWRWNMLVPQMLDPIEGWIRQAIALATGSTEPFKLAWTPPRREMIDPDTELKSANTAIRSGLSSRSQELRRLGMEPADIDEEIAADNKRADSLGLVLDSDPRKITANGMIQSVAAKTPASAN